MMVSNERELMENLLICRCSFSSISIGNINSPSYHTAISLMLRLWMPRATPAILDDETIRNYGAELRAWGPFFFSLSLLLLSSSIATEFILDNSNHYHCNAKSTGPLLLVPLVGEDGGGKSGVEVL